MAKLKPWFHVVTPREDLREGHPLDASEFAVHLDHIRDGRARKDYQEPAAVLRADLPDQEPEGPGRPGGAPALRHRGRDLGRLQHGNPVRRRQDARPGPALPSRPGRGRSPTTGKASDPSSTRPRSSQVPQAATAVFVGQKFDSIHGRGGNGEPRRKTPWGEIAWQLGGAKAFAVVAQHDEEGIAPGGDAIRAFLPDGPTLILMDELLNYVSRERPRKSRLGDQLYNFLQNLSEEARRRRTSSFVSRSRPPSWR